MNDKNNKIQITSLNVLTGAALLLPGLQPLVHAAEDDSIDFQYSHFQEGRRNINHQVEYVDQNGILLGKVKVPNNRNPIEVDSLHGSARVTLTDRIKFAFNYLQDTWSGATPLGSAPEGSSAISPGRPYLNNHGIPVYTGASPYADAEVDIDKQGNTYTFITDPKTLNGVPIKSKPVHVMSYASPETRKQGDFKLTYEWDEVALDVGGGISLENDYESRFANLGGRIDFNQKRTTVNLGISYTNSAIAAVLDPIGDNYTNWAPYRNQIESSETTFLNTLKGTRQDWAASLGLTQVVNKDALAELSMSYTRSTGFLENPYKLSWIFAVDPVDPFNQGGGKFLKATGEAFIEQRPNERNLFNWNARWVQYVEPLDAALHLDYSFAHDDWGINAHTFQADWVQPLGGGWAITPRIRYYSQEAADFYAPYFLTTFKVPPSKQPLPFPDDPSRLPEKLYNLPDNFSSDQRLSGYGTLSGGITISKQFAKGVGIEAGFEYYTHQGSLKLGGGGEGSFADFDYWVANAALKVNMAAIGQSIASGGVFHNDHANHPNLPAGVLFGHNLVKAGDMMIGYRYMRNEQAGNFLRGGSTVSEQQITNKACPGLKEGCDLLPRYMTMNMHMLDLMIAPTGWLTLMLMPQFTDMEMFTYRPASKPPNIDSHSNGDHANHTAQTMETGGVGDTGMYAMFKLFDQPHHHIHGTLGVTAPTGDVGIKQKVAKSGDSKDRDGNFIHYGMQLGSGTWDFKPSLTYTGKAYAWSWGAQAVGTKRLENRNSSGYALGDMFEGSIWGGYAFTRWLSGTVRVAYSWQDVIKGSYPGGRLFNEAVRQFCPRMQFTHQDDIDGDGVGDGPSYFHQDEFDACVATNTEDLVKTQDAEERPGSMDAPSNYGGHYVDIGFGLSATLPSGAFAGNRLAFEWLQPVYTNVNGYQLDRNGALSFTWSYGF